MFPTHIEQPLEEGPPSSAGSKARSRRLSLSRKLHFASTDQQRMEKLKRSKEEAMVAKESMLQALKKYRQLQNEISKNDRMAHLAKANCMKLYEVKKQRLLSKSLLEDRKHKDMQDRQQKLQSVRRLRLEQEYFKKVIENQELFRAYKLREQVGKYKQTVRDALSFKNRQLLEENRERYAQARMNKSRQADRKHLIEQLTMQKSKENYLCKLEAQIAKIQAYNVPNAPIQDLLIKLEEDEKNALEGLQASKYFEARAVEDVDQFLRASDRKEAGTSVSFFLTDPRQQRTANG